VTAPAYPAAYPCATTTSQCDGCGQVISGPLVPASLVLLDATRVLYTWREVPHKGCPDNGRWLRLAPLFTVYAMPRPRPSLWQRFVQRTYEHPWWWPFGGRE
jgi:hypothetical protein